MIKAKRIGHATFVTPDIDRQIEHYREVVGLHLIERDSDRAFLATNRSERHEAAISIRARGIATGRNGRRCGTRSSSVTCGGCRRAPGS
jgi:catechol 2,3-dioxygenase-like lactoylglutathione lyase family enzyme